MAREDAALLDMIEQHKLSVGPQCNGGWVIKGSYQGFDDAQEYDLARTRKGLRPALRMAASELKHSLPALGTAARSAETLGSAEGNGPAPQGATPTPDPVGKAKALLEGLHPRLTPEQWVRELRHCALDTDVVGGLGAAQEALDRADRIEAALATIHASQDQAGEVRS
jgi:hypothetical protein